MMHTGTAATTSTALFKWALIVLSSFVSICGCAQKQATNTQQSAALDGANRLERRAQLAFEKGDSAGAYQDYLAAAKTYESLALLEPFAQTQLSLARIEAQDNKTLQALQRMEDVLSLMQAGAIISPATQLMVHGRVAALQMQAGRLTLAGQHLSQAQSLCGALSACAQTSALSTLKANWYAAQQQFELALQEASAGVQAAVQALDKANALRSRAQITLQLNAGRPLADQVQAALGDAHLALLLDQTLGLPDRVIADLTLLTQGYSKAEQQDKAAYYQKLKERAVLARQARTVMPRGGS